MDISEQDINSFTASLEMLSAEAEVSTETHAELPWIALNQVALRSHLSNEQVVAIAKEGSMEGELEIDFRDMSPEDGDGPVELTQVPFVRQMPIR